jgi:hypothetical protein
MGPRRKLTCFGCRAIRVSFAGAACALDFAIVLPSGEFFRPGHGQICPKPATFGQLSVALRGERVSGGGTREIQLSLL